MPKRSKNCKNHGIKSHRSHISGKRSMIKPFGKFCKNLSEEEHSEWLERFKELENERLPRKKEI